MKLNNIKPAEGAKNKKHRVGRGIGSGFGKTCGRGYKGQKSRSGGFHKISFEGGQMPLHRRLPKRGFRSKIKKFYEEIRLKDIDKISLNEINIKSLQDSGLIKNLTKNVKIIATGKLSRKINVIGINVTKGARTIIESLGGTISSVKKNNKSKII